jgi:Tol biopolymer transport system component
VADIFTVDLRNGVFTPFTSDPATDTSPVWSHDGSRIFFASNRNNLGTEMYEKPFGLPAAETLVLSTPGSRNPMDWSRDGKYLLYWRGASDSDLWALGSDGSEIQITRRAPVGAQWPQFSPDGKWIAFQSSALVPNAGPNEIYIHGPFEPPSVGQMSAKLSPSGGSWVRWAPNGKELFFTAPDGTLMTMPLEFDSNGQTFKAGTPTPLFRVPMNEDTNNYPQQYAVSADGQRFLVLAAPAIDSPIKVILNWKPE